MIVFLKLLLGLANHLSKLIADRQLISAGEAKAMLSVTTEILGNLEKANEARRSVDPNDPSYNDDYAKRVRDANERQ